jgi:DNA-binding protein HU-beta
MTLADLYKASATKAGITQKDTEKACRAVFEVLAETMRKGDKVTIPNFGTFNRYHKKETQGFNPSTRERIKIPAKDVPKVTFSEALKKSFK